MNRKASQSGANPRVGKEWQLTDLIDLDTLQSIQDTFARTFGLPTVIVYPDATNATEITHRLSFCEDYTRNSRLGGPRCMDCDLRAMHEAAGSSRPHVFHCWNGLYDCAIPIAPKGKVLGYFLCGQVFTEDPDEDVYRERAMEIGVPAEAYVSALKDVRVIPRDRFEASVQSMHVLAEMIADQAAAAMDNFAMLQDALKAKEDTAKLVEELDGILEAFADMGSHLDYRATLESIADNLTRLIPYDSCLIYVLEDRGRVVPVVVRDPYADAVRRFRPTLGAGIVGKVAETGIGRRIDDAAADREFAPIPGVPVEPEAMLVVPMIHKGDISGVISLSRFRRRVFTDHELRLLTVFSSQAALALRNAHMHQRERLILQQYRVMSELGSDLAKSVDADDAVARLLRRLPEVTGADVGAVALMGDVPEEVEVSLRIGRRDLRSSIDTSSSGRLAAIRLRSDRPADRSVFDAWAEEVRADIAKRGGARSILAEPLVSPTGILGGLFVGWRSEDVRIGEEQHAILRVLTGTAAANLANFAALAQTDQKLRRRLAELQALTRLGERISGLNHEQPIIDELLAALRELGHLRGAAYVVRDEETWKVHQVSGLDTAGSDRVRDAVENIDDLPRGTRLAESERELLAFPMTGRDGRKALLVGVGDRAVPQEHHLVLWTLARYGSVALENARLHDRQQQTIAGLERANRQVADQYGQLQQILSVHESLTAAMLEGQGLDSVARVLAELLNAVIAIVGPSGGVLASWPGVVEPVTEPSLTPQDVPATIVTEWDGMNAVAAPATVDGEVLAWLLARPEGAIGDVERAAAEYGATLAALELLRERASIEVETRLRGGFIEELFSGSYVDDLILKQGVSLGFDLGVPSRVVLVEPAVPDTSRFDLEILYGVVSDVLRAQTRDHLVAMRGNVVVALVNDSQGEGGRPFEDAARARIEDRMPYLLVNIGVGTSCDGLTDYRRSYLAARRGLDLLRLLGRAGETFSFRQTGVAQVLLQASDPEVLLDFVSRYVEPLESYDRMHSSDLARSLHTYYQSGLNLEATARSLHIHVSTLRYRLTKIQDLLGVDPREGEARLDVEVALKTARVLAAYRD